MAHHPTPHDDPKGDQPVITDLAPRSGVSRLSDLTPEEFERVDAHIDHYNDGQPLDVHSMAHLFQVETNTIYTWIKPEMDQPASEALPPTVGEGNYWDPRTAILWGVRVGRLEWNGRRFVRRRLQRLLSPGKPRGPHRTSGGTVAA